MNRFVSNGSLITFASGYTVRPESPKQEARLHVDNFTTESFFIHVQKVRNIHNAIFDMKRKIKIQEIERISHC